MTIPAARSSKLFLAVALSLCGLAAPGRVASQETLVPLVFSFSDPGARSMGFGGAFERFQIDVGLDLSDEMETASLSGVYSF